MTDQTYSAKNIRHSVRYFAIGKALTAPASVLLVFLFATFMPRPEYAAYIAATAMLELLLAFGTLGLDWLSQTVVPAVRTAGTVAQLRRSVFRLMSMQCLSYLVIGLFIGVFAGQVSSWLSGVVPPEIVRLYAFTLTIEGIGRMLRDQLLAALLIQRAVQGLQIFRLLLMMSVLVSLHLTGVPVTAWYIAIADLCAAAGTVLIGGWVLWRYLHSQSVEAGAATAIDEWFGARSIRFAASAYGSFLLTISLGPEVATAIVARTLGVEATAQFGFAARMAEQVRRFLPMDLLWVVVRPALAGRFEAGGRDFARLVSDVSTILRANLLLLGAVAVAFIGAGDLVMNRLTRNSVHLPAFVLAVMLLPVLGHGLRRALELLTFMIGQARLFLVGSFASLLVPALLFLLLPIYGSLYVVGLSMGAAEALFSASVLFLLRYGGRRVEIDVFRWVRLSAVIAVAGIGCRLLATHWPGDVGLVVSLAAGGLLYLALLWGLRIVSAADLHRLRDMVRSRR